MNKQRLIQAWSPVKRFRWFIYAGVCFILLFVLFLDVVGLTRSIDDLIGPHPQLSWPTVQGTVLSTELQCQDTTFFRGTSYWDVNVRFAYQVRASKYAGEQKIMLLEAVSYSDAEDRAKTFQVFNSECVSGDRFGLERVQEAAQGRLAYHSGQQVPIYYNPEQPGEAVLKPGAIFDVTNITYGQLIVVYTVLILIIGGILMLIAGIQGLRRK